MLTVEDLASTNGTFLNGQRITGRRPVRPGDVVALGASELRALSAPTTAPAQPRAPAAPVPHPAPAAAAPAPHPAPAPHQQPGRPPAPAQPGSPPAPGSRGLLELSGVQPSFVATVGRYLGRVIGVYLALAVLLGAVASLLQVVHRDLGVTLPAAFDPGHWARPAAWLLPLSGVALAAVAYLRSAATRLSLRAGRLDIDRGLLRRQVTAVDLRRLRRVTLDQTALQRLTGDGTLLLELVDHADPIPSPAWPVANNSTRSTAS